MMNATATLSDRLGLTRRQLLLGLLVVDLQILVALFYPLLPSVRSIDPFVLVFPLVWINVGLWAIVTTKPASTSTRMHYLGIGIGVAYFLVLAYVGGVVQPGHAFHGHAHSFSRWAWPLPPGFGPAYLYSGTWIGLNLVPYKVVGYAALAYLVYATVLDVSGSLLAGFVGLFSCVSCALPVVGMVTAVLFGGTSAVANAALDQTFLLSTAVFLVSVALLRWRPTIGSWH